MFRFRPDGCYQNEMYYAAFDSSDPDSRSYRLAWQHPMHPSLEDYRRRVANPCVDFDTEVLGKVGGVSREDGKQITEEGYRAFRDFITTAHEKECRGITAMYERLEVAAEDREPLPKLSLPRPVYYCHTARCWVNPVWFYDFKP